MGKELKFRKDGSGAQGHPIVAYGLLGGQITNE